MSDSIKIILTKDEYNAVFALAGVITGQFGTVSASKIRDIISAEVQRCAVNAVLPKSITINIPKKVLDGFYIGLTDKTKEAEINTLAIFQIKAVASILKMKGRIEKFLESEFEKTPVNDEEFDQEDISEPFDEAGV